MVNLLRKAGINSEVYLNKKSLKGKLNYANKLGIPYVIIVGEDEVKNKTVTVKDMKVGEQKTYLLNQSYNNFDLLN